MPRSWEDRSANPPTEYQSGQTAQEEGSQPSIQLRPTLSGRLNIGVVLEQDLGFVDLLLLVERVRRG